MPRYDEQEFGSRFAPRGPQQFGQPQGGGGIPTGGQQGMGNLSYPGQQGGARFAHSGPA